MEDYRLDRGLQAHIRALAQAVLQHLFYPTVLRHVAHRRRVLLNERVIEDWGWPAVQEGVTSVLLHASLLGEVLNQHHFCGQRPTGEDSRGSPSRRSSASHRLDVSSRHSGSPMTQREFISSLHPQFQQTLENVLNEERRSSIRVVAGGERLVFEGEQASEVLLLLSGSWEELGGVAPPAQQPGDMMTKEVTAIETPSREKSLTPPRHVQTLGEGSPLAPLSVTEAPHEAVEESDPLGGEKPAEEGGPVASTQDLSGKTVELFVVAAAGEQEGGNSVEENPPPPPTPPAQAVAVVLPQTSPASTHSQSSFEPPQAVRCSEAPAVFGEIPCLAGCVYGSTLVVKSEWAVVASISREDYSMMVSFCGSWEGQRLLMVEALKFREALLPRFSPMTTAQLRLSPLFCCGFPDAVLKGVIQMLEPRVYPAGSALNRMDSERCLYFFQKGVVRREPDSRSARDGNDLQGDRPRNQVLWVDGQSYGEIPWAFRENARDTIYAVTHVDAYVLPYSSLTHLQATYQNSRFVLEANVRTLREIRNFPHGSLKFIPTAIADPRSYLVGVIPEDSYLVYVFKRVAIDYRFSSDNSTSRRVTINDQEETREETALRGGRVCPALIQTIQQVPLISLVSPPSFAVKCLGLWNCVSYRAGDKIIRRGEECNRLLYFYYGSAGVVLDEKKFQREGPTAINTLRIPKGQTIGYTCVRRHRWTRSVVCMENGTEVWELKRSALVSLLHQFNVADLVNAAALQVLQPLYPSELAPETASSVSVQPTGGAGASSMLAGGGFVSLEASVVVSPGQGTLSFPNLTQHKDTTEEESLDLHRRKCLMSLCLQPLLRPMGNSLWGSQAVPNLHPVSRVADKILYPVWQPGDFPLAGGSSSLRVGVDSAASSRSRRMSKMVVSSLGMPTGGVASSSETDLLTPAHGRKSFPAPHPPRATVGGGAFSADGQSAPRLPRFDVTSPSRTDAKPTSDVRGESLTM